LGHPRLRSRPRWPRQWGATHSARARNAQQPPTPTTAVVHCHQLTSHWGAGGTTKRSRSRYRSFPYTAGTTCYIEVHNDGTVTHGDQRPTSEQQQEDPGCSPSGRASGPAISS
jgi:hypothetical protein